MAGIAQPSGFALPDRFHERLLESRDGLWNIYLGSLAILVAIAHRHLGSRYGGLHNSGVGAALVEFVRARTLHAGHAGRLGIPLVDGLLESVDWIFEVTHMVCAIRTAIFSQVRDREGGPQ